MFPLHESQYIEEPQTDDFDPLCICGTRELPFVEVDDGWRKGDHTAHCDEQTRAAEQPRNPSPSSLLFCSTAACHCCVDAACSLPSHESSLPPINSDSHHPRLLACSLRGAQQDVLAETSLRSNECDVACAKAEIPVNRAKGRETE